ncbi:hypothetical protein OSSY52_21440 [Tepiditoga spiralis]|uniref:Uncharacterized protein n=1 Tax=Tepiditoga spiralis TaxID=2108365 RepID=A0A7G1GA90_9BACT|nr:hypothetical protein [Tepiditoga spiralis]BBE32003.1 hypothetical protein OSSY52_21440 [Tepiditoga spiralis]
MKKVFFVLSFLILLFLLVSCSQSIKYKINIPNLKVSKNFPLAIKTNFNYSKIKMSIDSSPVNFIASPEGFYIKNLENGLHKLKVEFLDNKDSLITDVSTELFYDSILPKIQDINKEIENGKLKIKFKIDSSDYAYSNIYLNEVFEGTTKDSSITIPLIKNSGNIKVKLKVFDKLKNESETSFMLDTSKDSTPVILSDTLKLNLFSNLNILTKDDWDKSLKTFIYNDSKYLYPYEILSTDSTQSTVIVFDSSRNYSKKLMNISFDTKIPNVVKNTTILLSNKDTLFSWETDPNIQSYVVEHYEDKWGWKPFLETELSFAEVKNNDIMFVRKKTKNGTLGFPSTPIYRFSSNINFYSASTIENIKNSTYLLKINSPFFVPFDFLIEKGKTLFVESGSEIRFSNNARMIIKGTLFIMEGIEKSKLSGKGTIYLDGGTIIMFDTDIESINIEGRGNVIFIQNSNFLNKSIINLKSITRFCSYYNKLKDVNINLNNSSGVYFYNTKMNDLKISNVAETLIEGSIFNSINTKIKSRILFENSNVNIFYLDTFSYLYSHNSIIKDLKKNSYSIFVKRSDRID